MIKFFKAVALTAIAAVTLPAAAQFSELPVMFTAAELAVNAAALTPTAIANSIAAFDAVAPMKHPRMFKGQADYLGIVAATKAERSSSIIALTGYLQRNSVAIIVTPELRAQINSPIEATRMTTWWKQNRILEGMGESAVAWNFTKNPWFLAEMRARMQLFGPAVVARNCTGDVAETRDYVWYFALAYDFAFDAMTAPEKQLVKDVILKCAGSGLLATPTTVQKYPENAIAYNALGKLMGALLIVRGDMPETKLWLHPVVTQYVTSTSPWGGEDGGFANGSSYAEWEAGESLTLWDLVDRVLGVPLYKKPWVAELPRYIAYTLPPGTPVGVFGDGAEVRRPEDWARFGKAIMNRSDTALSRWYIKQQSGEDYARLHILLSPREYPTITTLPAGVFNSAYFPAIGSVAMHSMLADRARTSVFFKSSPFGSSNHSHADQNSFVLYSKGKVLAMDSGAYDYYNSPHWRDYYKQTKAHNAITFDGGQGQTLGATGLGLRSANGKLTKMVQQAGYDITSGDALAAYNGLLTRAKRTIVFIRPSTMVVIDQLNSLTPRKYEYNLHTGVPLTGTAAAFRAEVLPAEMCGVIASPDPLTQTNSVGYFPQPTIAADPHFWNKFNYATARNKGFFVSVLRTNCLTAAPVITFGATGGATVSAGGKVVVVTDLDVTVQ